MPTIFKPLHTSADLHRRKLHEIIWKWIKGFPRIHIGSNPELLFLNATVFSASMVLHGLICSFGRLSQFAAIQEGEILHAAVPRIYYSISWPQYTIHIIYSSHGPLSPNTNENICRLFQLNSTHKTREKIGFIYSHQTIAALNIKHFTSMQLNEGVNLQQW